jgi:hypothetical protein
VFLDVVYALLFVEMLRYLPAAENLAWVGQAWGLLGVMVSDPNVLLRIVIGLGLTLIYWMLSNRLLGPLDRTDTPHTLFCLLQMVGVSLFLYFAIQDPGLVGGPSSPALQSVSMTSAGLLGLMGWNHARRRSLVAPTVTEQQRREITLDVRTQTITAAATIPLAWLGPLVWTAGWVLLPLAIGRLLEWRGRSTAAVGRDPRGPV